MTFRWYTLRSYCFVAELTLNNLEVTQLNSASGKTFAFITDLNKATNY